MIYTFTKKITCTKTCHEDFEKKLIAAFPLLESSKNFHCTILHDKPHTFEVVLYDKGEHEFMRDGKKISSKFDRDFQKLFKGKLPTLSDLEDL
mgnify:CR=1 FL=1